MTKLIRLIFSALSLAGLFACAMSAPVIAAPQAGNVSAQVTQTPLTFAMLGLADMIMRGPFATANVRFGLPVDWAVSDGASLKLILSSSLVSDGLNAIADGQPIGAGMTVRLNKKVIATLPLLAGTDVSYEVPLPKDTFVSTSSDGRHDLELFLDASTDCNINNGFHQTTVTVSAASQFVIPYKEQAPVLDLALLPHPIFQRDSFFPANAVLVVPDQASEQEIQAALIVSAGFGRSSGGKLPLSLLTSSQVTQEIVSASNLIFVGKASGLSQLQHVELPAPLTNGAFSPAGMQTDDGVLQMATSPWSNGRTILIVSGNTDVGVVKAAKALSHGEILPISNSTLALVADVTPATAESQTDDLGVAQRTFRDLGHDVETITGEGKGDINVEFYVSPGLVAGEGSYLDLRINNSALLDFGRSGLAVFLNGKNLGGVRLTQETAATATQRINIAPSLVLPGNNQLRIQADLAALTQCSLVDQTNIWVSVLPESVLYLPLEQAPADNNKQQTLSVYPYPFVNLPTLSNTAFVLPKDDSTSWSVASQIAYGIGNQARGSVLDLAVVYDGAVTDEIRNSRDLILVGLPTDLTLLREINGSLPAPFETGQSDPVVQKLEIRYRVARGTSLGYLELLPAPWNAEKTILAVVGNSHDGLQMAANALTDSALRKRLTGNFAMVNAENISPVDTRTGLGLGRIAANPEVVSQPATRESVPQTFAAARPAWILPAVGIIAFLIVGVLLVAIIAGRRAPDKH